MARMARIGEDGEDTLQTLPVEGVFIYVAGSKPITDFVEGQVEMQEDGGVKVRIISFPRLML